ncbi:PD-(D/E)XK nuclease family protein [Synechococcus sp. HK01-R]|uniref:PD-(D/E)XK nuclease family protein n=1 Tax=Synechococcus sp. HK01-R TaxID=2751171 RepID=UPI00162A0E31|nr:PD-(D/E)XK nuclease family protein [Synechococcus sp. HK01-R]QNG26095.1 PD-(D/E)XK nuclease family protein [Synechococcus sp. HK01-R]
MKLKPPIYSPIQPITISERWFPRGRDFGLYESQGVIAPNVTSILGWKFPFDKSKWIEAEPDVDHDAVARESAERGTAVHYAMEQWLQGKPHEPLADHLPWINPLQELVSKAKKTLAVEIPVHTKIAGLGYAGSCDGLMMTDNGDVVIIDYKTKRENKKVHSKFCDKQRTQLAAYSLAINELYGDQLPSPVKRCSLLFAHPEPGRPVTVVSTEGLELRSYQEKWLEILENWYAEHGDAVAEEQARFNRKNEAPPL